MRFFKTGEFCILICLAFVIILFGAALYTSKQTGANPKSYAHSEHAESYEIEIKKERSFDESISSDPVAFYTKALFWATTILAVFTLILAGVTIFIWLDGKEVAAKQQVAARRALMHAVRSARASERAIEAANISSERQLRAYISIISVTYIGLFGEKPLFNLEYANRGQTPAYRIRFYTVLNKISKADQVSYAFDDSLVTGERGSMGECGPGASQSLPKRGPRQLAMAEIDAVRSGDAGIFYWGEIVYEDAFGKTRATKFRNSINDIDGPLQNSGSMGVCFEGNEAT